MTTATPNAYTRVLDLLEGSRRNGSATDEPEGTRYIAISDTMAARLANDLRAAMAEEAATRLTNSLLTTSSVNIANANAERLDQLNAELRDAINRLAAAVEDQTALLRARADARADAARAYLKPFGRRRS